MDDCSEYQLCRLVVADGHAGLESAVVKLRAHFLRRGRLLHLDRDLDTTTRTLDVAATLPDYLFAGESRLDYNEPMERLRIKIAHGDFAAALDYADEAEANTGPPHSDARPTHPPIGIIARADLRFLRGVALAGLDLDDPDALYLIESAIAVVKESASSLPETQRQRLLKRFADWDRIAHRIQREVFPQREEP